MLRNQKGSTTTAFPLAVGIFLKRNRAGKAHTMGTGQFSNQQFRQTKTRIRALQAQWKRMRSLTEPELEQLLTATMRELSHCSCTSQHAESCHKNQEPERNPNNPSDRQACTQPNPEAALPSGCPQRSLPCSVATQGRCLKARPKRHDPCFPLIEEPK